MKTFITADDLEYDLTVVEPRISTLPLVEEITASLQTLRARGYVRAANRLEKVSSKILNAKTKSETANTRRIPVRAIQTASGKKLKLTRAISIDADRIEK